MITRFFAIAVMMNAHFGLADDDAIAFIGESHENSKFVTILANGNGSSRNAHLTVYEVLTPDFKLRRLHSRFLMHQCHYQHCCLCAAGRFFITINDWWAGEISHPLVIYDLARNEYTSYSVDELFTVDQLSTIRKTMGREREIGTVGFEWAQTLEQSEHHFDPKSLTFTIHGIGPWAYDKDVLRGWGDLPELLEIEKPFVPVVIDLPTRIAKAISSPQTKDIREVKRDGVRITCVNQWSIESAIYDNAEKRILLPRMVQVNYLTAKLTYRLDSETQEYTIVEPSEMITVVVPNVCSADQDKERRKQHADEMEAAMKENEDKQERSSKRIPKGE